MILPLFLLLARGPTNSTSDSEFIIPIYYTWCFFINYSTCSPYAFISFSTFYPSLYKVTVGNAMMSSILSSPKCVPLILAKATLVILFDKAAYSWLKLSDSSLSLKWLITIVLFLYVSRNSSKVTLSYS